MLSIDEVEVSLFKIHPNPSSEFIQVFGLLKTEDFKIFNVLGKEIANGIISNHDKIDIQNLTNGVYFLKVQNKEPLKFIKEE